MVERAKRFPGLLTPCPGCQKQPMIMMNFAGTQNHMECYPCRIRLPSFPTDQEAVQSWECFCIALAPMFPKPEVEDVVH